MKKIVRQYVVDKHQPGVLQTPIAPTAPFTDEESAIGAFRDVVSDAAAEALVNGEITAQRQTEIHQTLQAIMVGSLLGLGVTDSGVGIQVGKVRHFIMRIADASPTEEELSGGERQVPIVEIPATRKTLVERKRDLIQVLDQAIKDGDAQTARDVMASIDEMSDPRAQVQRAADQERAEIIVNLIRFIHNNGYVKPTDEMSEMGVGERNGLIYAILTAAQVPYAVVGEMRPSREWTSAHMTLKMLVLDKDLDPYETAAWLIGLPKGEAAPPNQPDFAEQIRLADAEQVKKDVQDLLHPNPWFDSEARASVALDGETFAVEEPKQV